MIQLSLRGKIQYRFLDLIVGLLLCYAVAFLLESLFHLPVHPLPHWFSGSAIARLSAASGELLILSAFVAAGLAMMGAELDERRLLWLQRGWSALALIALVAAPMLDSPLPDVALAIFMLATLVLSRVVSAVGAPLRVWRIGLLLLCLSLLLTPLFQGRWLEALELFRLHVGYGVCGVSLVFWLMRGFSRVEREWADDGVVIVAALVFLGGGLISLAPLGLPLPVSLSATPLILLSFMILAGHFYRALSLRSADASLAAHWVALATLFWLVGAGFLGAITVHAGVYRALQGTALADARNWLLGWVAVAIALAFVNAKAGELRGDNRRVTGYVPFWLISFGVGTACVLMICRGVAQYYLRTAGGLEATELLLPLTALWMLCLLAVGCGALTYALGYRARRPRIKLLTG